MILPTPPMYTNDLVRDLELVKTFISDLHSALLNLNTEILETIAQSGYTATGVIPDRSLIVGDSLADTQHFLGTLVNDLIAKEVISA